MQIFPNNYGANTDSAGRDLLAHLLQEERRLHLADAIIFCEFPLFRDEDDVLLSKILIISPHHGVVILGTFEGRGDDEDALGATIAQTDGVFANVYAKLIKSGRLRASRTALRFPVEAAIFAPELDEESSETGESTLLPSLRSTVDFLASIRVDEPLDAEIVAEITSVVEGSKGLVRPRPRKVDAFPEGSKVHLVRALEEEIRRFDRDQRTAYMTDVFGPQRITGLAGSGKTVVLAMKAAQAHLKNPDARIAFTFYTKSLYQQVKQLITRFYRQFDDRDPNWDRLKVLHAWGGEINEGLYYYAAKACGETPLTFAQAKALSPRRPFDAACSRLLDHAKFSSLFDFIFVDEAQDFPPSFLRMALKLASEEKLVIAYDVFQTIFDVEIPSAAILFGTTETGEPAVTFEEDVVLHKCYRNPLEVLVCAHAVGFGLYSDRVVQMLDSKEHWEDFGYIVESEQLKSGQHVVIRRPEENSPLSISSATSGEPVISVQTFAGAAEEAQYVIQTIANDITAGGLSPEDILVICADDLNSRRYLRAIANGLRDLRIATNNLQDDSYALRDFVEKDHVTLSSIYKAKGNEAFVVFVVGVDALFSFPNARRRNTVFTAMTRARGWLRVSGVGPAADKLGREVAAARRHVPRLVFTYPSPEQLIQIKRDLTEDTTERAATALDELEGALDAEEYEQVLVRKLQQLRKKKRTRASAGSRQKKL